jgi:hypothetical protein
MPGKFTESAQIVSTIYCHEGAFGSEVGHPEAEMRHTWHAREANDE